MKKRVVNIVLSIAIALSSLAIVLSLKQSVSAVSVGGDWSKLPGGSGGGSCGSGNCYNLNSSGVRISLVDDNGNRIAGTKSVDYWFDTNDRYPNKNVSGFAQYCSSAKYNKKEAMSLTSTSGFSNCSPSFNNISNLLNVNISNPRSTGEVDTVMNEILQLGKSTKGERGHANWAVYDKIFAQTGYKVNGQQVTILNINAEEAKKIYIEFEPLVSFINSGSATTDSVLYGTISEAAAIGNLGGINYGLNGPIVNYMFQTVKWDGISSTSSKPSAYQPISNVAGSLTNFFGVSSSGKYYGYSVGFIYLGDLTIGSSCDETIQKALKSYTEGKSSASDYAKVVKSLRNTDSTCKADQKNCDHLDLEDVAFYGFTYNTLTCEPIDCGDEVSAIIKNCYGGTCSNYSGAYKGKTYEEALDYAFKNTSVVKSVCGASGSKCNRLFKENIELYGIPSSSNACSLLSCDQQAQDATNKYRGNVSKLKQYLNWLYTNQQTVYGKTFPLLDYALWHDELGLSEPKCGELPQCEPTLVGDNCTTGSVSFKDSTKTNCWYDEGVGYNIKGGARGSSKDLTLSGNACNVMCQETVTFNFPTATDPTIVKAGKTFVWGTLNNNRTSVTFGTMNLTKVCKAQTTEMIDGNLITYDQNETQMKSNYAKWQAALSVVNSNITASPNANKCGTWKFNGTDKAKYYASKGGYSACNAIKSKAIDSVRTQAREAANSYEARYNTNVSIQTKYANGGGVCKTNKINDTWANSDHVKTTIKLNYSEPTTPSNYNTNNITLDRIQDSNSYSAVTNLRNGTKLDASNNAGCTSTLKDKIVCQNGSCKVSGKIRVYDCSNVNNWTLSQTYRFNYPDELYWYSDKTDSSLLTQTDVDHDTNGNRNKPYYYEIGYGLPTSFTTPRGTYNGMEVQISLVGSYQNNKGHFDDLIKRGYAGLYGQNLSYFTYSCPFKINNELFATECEYDANGNLIAGSPEYCDPKDDPTPEGMPTGIDVVFRTIDLINAKGTIKDEIERAFPGRAGVVDSTSRRIGSNWDKLDEATIVSVLDDTVYSKKDPQYHIELTTSIIQRIRGYNKTARNSHLDPYSAMEIIYNDNDTGTGYTGYICLEENGKKYCGSTFLSSLISNRELTGTCAETSSTRTRTLNHLRTGC